MRRTLKNNIYAINLISFGVFVFSFFRHSNTHCHAVQYKKNDKNINFMWVVVFGKFPICACTKGPIGAYGGVNFQIVIVYRVSHDML
jgi:hypothetical protein